MGRIFLTSDLHYSHDREFVYKPRGFSSIEEMNEAIFNNYQAIVTDEDTCIIAGDLMLGDNSVGMEYLNKMNGKKIPVLGNHDTDARIALYKSVDSIEGIYDAYRFKYKKLSFFVCHYPTVTTNIDHKEHIYQCTTNLFGHTHQQTNFYNDIPFMYHVGVDSHDCKPVLIDDIIVDIKNKIEECKMFL